MLLLYLHLNEPIFSIIITCYDQLMLRGYQLIPEEEFMKLKNFEIKNYTKKTPLQLLLCLNICQYMYSYYVRRYLHFSHHGGSGEGLFAP